MASTYNPATALPSQQRQVLILLRQLQRVKVCSLIVHVVCGISPYPHVAADASMEQQLIGPETEESPNRSPHVWPLMTAFRCYSWPLERPQFSQILHRDLAAPEWSTCGGGER